MSEWQELAERLVEVDLRIEDLDAWATELEDVAELQRLEELRDEMQAAVAHHRIGRRLRQWLHDGRERALTAPTTDPRD